MAAIALRSHRAASRLLKNCPALLGSLGSISGSSHDVAAPVLESPKEVVNRNNAAAGFAVIPFSMRGFAAVASEEDIAHHVEEERGIAAAQGEENSEEDAELALFSSADSLVNVTGEDALKYITFRSVCILQLFGLLNSNANNHTMISM